MHSPTTQHKDVFELSLEELQHVKVTTAGKKPQDLFQVPSAIAIVGKEDIYQSGLTSLPDLMRLVPGVDAAQISSQKWAVSARGFNFIYASKLLALVDGRVIYSPFFGGVYWEAQDYPLEDIDRIEVIRGPGATLWGSDAVNGVVNVVSKNAKETLRYPVDQCSCWQGPSLSCTPWRKDGGFDLLPAFCKIYRSGFTGRFQWKQYSRSLEHW